MTSQKDFIDRINEYRRLSVNEKHAEQEEILRVTSEMRNALGHMIAFTSMNTVRFPVKVELVPSIEHASDPNFAAYGMHLVAIGDDHTATNLNAEIVTPAGTESFSVKLHHTKGSIVKHWSMERSFTDINGLETIDNYKYETTDWAIQMFRARLTSSVVDYLSNGYTVLESSIPVKDAWAAVVIRNTIERALDTGNALENNARNEKEARMMTAYNLSNLWTMGVSRLDFLIALGFEIDNPKADRNIICKMNQSGIEITVKHGHGYESSIKVSSSDDDSNSLFLTLADENGYDVQVKDVFQLTEANLLNDIHELILSEIESSEKAWINEINLSNEGEIHFSPC